MRSAIEKISNENSTLSTSRNRGLVLQAEVTAQCLIDENIRVIASVAIPFGQQKSHSFSQDFKLGRIFFLPHFLAQRAECLDVKH